MQGCFFDLLQAAIGRLIGGEEHRVDATMLQTWHEYDEHNRLKNQAWKMLDNTFKENYNYDTNGRLTKKTTTLPNGTTSAIQLTYGDALGRVSTVKTPVSTDYYNYLAGSGTNTTTPLVSAMSHNPNGNSLRAFSYRYEYDALGNITKITARADSEIDQISSYIYDSQSQLLSESYYSGYASYTYDTYGNIRTKEVLPQYDDEVLYAYNYGNSQWRDLLTSIKVTKNGTSSTYNYTYDAIGNPRQYYNVNNNATWNLRWIDGRSLHQAVGNGHTVNYQYGADNIRIKKTVDGVMHSYIYAGGKLLQESYTKNGTSYILDFVYDQNDRPYMLYLKKGTAAPEVFYYLLNLQGDVVRLVDANGTMAARYSYDAWGNVLSSSGSMASTNPLRYRGYYYDAETGWYYLQSRYYDPGLGRFINADCYTSTGQGFVGFNMFAYCGNQPIGFTDDEGTKRIAIIYDNRGGDQEFLANFAARRSDNYHKNGDTVVMFPVISTDSTVAAWNSLGENEYDHVDIVLHGAAGILACNGSIGNNQAYKPVSNFDVLDNISIKESITLFSCNGGTYYSGESVAQILADKANTRVRAAVNSKVYFWPSGAFCWGPNPFYGIWGTFYSSSTRYQRGRSSRSDYIPYTPGRHRR